MGTYCGDSIDMVDWATRDPNVGWSCRKCGKEIEADFRGNCPHCGERCQFIEYRGFKLKGTGGFFSGDGYVIYYVPPWLSKKAQEQILNTHMQDSVLMRWIDQIYDELERGYLGI